MSLPSLHRSPPAAAPAISLILAAACWGGGTALSKEAVGALPPLLLLPVQLLSSLVFLVVVGRLRRERVAFTTRPRLLGALGILNPGIAYALGLVALTQIDASLAVVVWATEPAMVALLAAAVLGERLRVSIVGLSAVAVAGILVLAGGSGSGATALGLGLTAAAVLCCAAYTVAVRRWIPDAPETIGLVSAQQVAALAFALALVAVAGPTVGLGPQGRPLDAGAVVAVVLSGLVYYGLAYWFYLDGLRRLPASLAATSFYLIPVFGLAAAFALGERLGPQAWLGAGIVLAAVASIGWLSRPERSAPRRSSVA